MRTTVAPPATPAARCDAAEPAGGVGVVDWKRACGKRLNATRRVASTFERVRAVLEIMVVRRGDKDEERCGCSETSVWKLWVLYGLDKADP